MKPYSSHPNYSMSMVEDLELTDLIQKEINNSNINYVLETGTFRGKGSTTQIAKSFREGRKPERFITIEANWRNWRTAKINLSKFKFVECVWGLTVPTHEAISFIENDEMLLNHDKYEDIYVDAIENPLLFYKKEIAGKSKLFENKILNSLGRVSTVIDKQFNFVGDDLLRKYLNLFQDKNPLILLDSAGGIGFLEFTIVRNALTNNEYLIILDDIHHIKHYRSYHEIKNSKDFEILKANEQNGWVFARHHSK